MSLFGSDVSSRFLWLRTATSSLLSRNSEHAAVRRTSVKPDPAPNHQERRGLRSLPRPNADGIVLLDKGPYEAGNLSYVGDLSIRGSGDSPSVVIVQDHPVEFVCRKFRMERVNVRAASPSTADSPRSPLPSDRKKFCSIGAPSQMREATVPPRLSGLRSTRAIRMPVGSDSRIRSLRMRGPRFSVLRVPAAWRSTTV